jgi:hypothetical protein
MPHTTNAYMFEFKVSGFAGEMCGRFTTGESPRSFLLILDQNGSVTSMSFDDGSPEWSERVWATTHSETPHLFYNPLDDGREYVWLSWKGIDVSVMERLIGRRFEESDFLPFPQFDHRARKLDPEKQFPQFWGVMF